MDTPSWFLFRLSLLFFLFFFLLSAALADPAMVLDLLEEWKTFFDWLPEDLRPASILTAPSPVMSAAPAPVVPRRRARRAAQRRAAPAAPSPAGSVPDSAPSPPTVGSDLVSLVEVHRVNEFA